MTMNIRTLLALTALSSMTTTQAFAAEQQAEAPKATPAQMQGEDGDVSPGADAVTHHEGVFHGQKVRYTATAGRIGIPGPDGSIDTQMFYVAYTKDGAASGSRPITFLTNGGPGAATAWLHLGGIGPRKVVLNDDGSVPAPPVRLMDNHESILDKTDLVFIDAPGAGFSRLSGDAAKIRILQKKGDLDTYASFIQSYLRRNERFGSPLYLFGESYGAFRIAGLSDTLVRRGVPIAGIVLLSAVLDADTLTPGVTNDWPFVLSLPSFAATAAFHGRLDPALAADKALRSEVEAWAFNVYAPALAKGNKLVGEPRQMIIDGLVRYTGLSPAVIAMQNLRVDTQVFMMNLQADTGLITGRVDGRLSGPAPASAVEEPYYDPAMGDLTPAFTAAASQYLFGELKYQTQLPYRMYSRDVAQRFQMKDGAGAEQVDTSRQSLSALQSTVVKNRAMKVINVQGLYDLATPYLSMKYSLDHMLIPKEYQDNIQFVLVPAGHMAYDDKAALKMMNDAIGQMYTQR